MTSHETTGCDVAIIGAGFAGLYAIYKARSLGLDPVCIEAAPDVGGVWYWNRYPGARCDVESIDYSYSFDPELQRDWRWSERYATQPEILDYARHVADRYRLRRHIHFGERVLSARFDEDAARWTVTTDAGRTISARWLISAVGSLSAPVRPDIPGIDSFAGEVAFTATWPEQGVDYAGKRVAVIGTGSSGVQSIPIIAREAAHVTVFQRSANYSVPALNRPIPDDEWQELVENYPARRAKSLMSGGGSPHEAHPVPFAEVPEDERQRLFEDGWQKGGVLFAKVFQNQTADPEINDAARVFAEDKIRAIVKDPEVARDLMPEDTPIGTKRICTDSGYFQTFNRDNVTLVNLRRDPITEIVPGGIVTEAGLHEADILILATGFDAITGAVVRIDFEGPHGNRLAEDWADGPETYLGLAVPGFPNLFNISGPGCPGVLANMVLGGEHQVGWVFEMIRAAEARGHRLIEARASAARAWTDHVAELADRTLFTKGNSWYLGANIEGKKRVFMPYIGGLGNYVTYCDQVRAAGYKGFVMGV
ncbi:flavin-containing monooxygenase [Maritimibacter fusiformis]|uniref:NAD(P)/FAD-dependent oxidoreductase n=1 Tax=Maritimibacter fusiformis TaxID=2603819 RepID=A0A5D0RRA5_9RHOB|nr:NAD(P)/FAD-dependent oxidoreductase [Maritimibacter fusiformis]TYB83208.1 NAD(P)/FAD-dependent oxidoreductase [Maritimibacter fusiformis]